MKHIATSSTMSFYVYTHAGDNLIELYLFSLYKEIKTTLSILNVILDRTRRKM